MKNEKPKVYKPRTRTKRVQKLHLKVIVRAVDNVVAAKCGNASVNNLTDDIEDVTCKVCLKGVGGK